MPICDYCNTQWTWKQTIKKLMTLDPAMICPFCGEKQYQTPKSKKKTAALNVVILLPLLFNLFFNMPWYILFSLFPVLFIAVMSAYPFFVVLSNQEKYFNIGER